VGDEADTVYHEYTHGLSNRLVTSDGFGAVSSPQAGAMGEAWSDWYAQDLLNAQGHRPDTLSDAQWSEECETLNRMGAACRAEGVWLALHNHAGSCWETEDELQRLATGTDPAAVALGPDVGHLVWGGVDPLPWFRRHMDRVKSIHIKDMHADVLRRCRDEKLTYGQTSDLGVFAEIGEGCVDWPALFGLWRDAGYEGAVIVETDRTTKPTAKESAIISRRYLREIVGM